MHKLKWNTSRYHCTGKKHDCANRGTYRRPMIPW